jgi:adenylate cyclase
MSESTQRRLAAIVSADVVGYSRLIGADEAGTLAALRAHRKELIDPLIGDHGGRIVKTMGDGLLLEFPSVVNATQCAIEIQHRMAGRNEAIDEARRLTFRIGINLGDIVIEGEDIHGDGVNVAARLQEAGEPGGLALSGIAHESLGNLVDAHFEDGGRQEFKNIARLIQVWRWSPTAQAPKEAVAEAPALPDKPSIGVLPFENMSGDPDQQYFADGIAEDVTTALSRFGSLFVIARDSSFTYKGTATDVTQVARELGVRYVVEGSVRKAGNRVRITAQLIDATNGKHLWADRFDGHLDDIFELQDKITEQIVVAVEPEIGAHERQLVRRKPPENLDAWELFQRGLSHFYGSSRSDHVEAVHRFEKSILADPEFALAHAQLALALCVDFTFGYVDDQAKAIASARKAAEQAVSLDPTEPMAHYARGRVHTLAEETEMAIAETQTAISINPNFAAAHYGLGFALYYGAGQSEQALPHFDNALRLSPRDPMRWATLMNKGSVLRILGRHDEAIGHCRQACQFLNGGYLPHMHLGAALAAAGREAEAKLAIDKALDLNPDLTVSYVHRNFVNLHETVMEGLVDSLTKAGLPETSSPRPEDETLSLPDKPSIAVLPFDNMSGDPEQEFFADGIAEDVITVLSRFRSLFVIARNSSFTYKGQAVDVTQVARDLGVRYLVEGSVRKAGNRVRITAQLIDATSGNHLWADRFDGSLDDVFDLQDLITEQIVVAVEPEIAAHERERARRKPPESLDAWTLVQRGLTHFHRANKTDRTEAIRLFKEAAELDSGFAAAHAHLAYGQFSTVISGYTDDKEKTVALALKSADKALFLDPNEPMAHFALGRLYLYAGEIEMAIGEMQNAIAINPNFSLGHYGLGQAHHIGAGRADQALTHYDTALRLSPRDPARWRALAVKSSALRFLGRLDEAIALCRQACQFPGSGLLPQMNLTAALAKAGQTDDARAAAEKTMQLQPSFSISFISSSFVGMNEAILKELIDNLRKAGVPED